MTREEFIKVLEEKEYLYEIKGDKVVLIPYMGIDLNSLESLPPGVVFSNSGPVYLETLKTIPPGTVFSNRSSVYLNSLETLPEGIVFSNGSSVYLDSLKSIPRGIEFSNEGNVHLKKLTGGFISKFRRIEGIQNKRLFNHMISQGLFEKERR